MSATEHRLALPAGYQLGKYRICDVLGAGGFGITYLAQDDTLARRVAIKELMPNDFATRLDGTTVVAKTRSQETNLAWARSRFLDEGRALAACDHPNVVHVYEMIEANGTAYMVTKYESGRSLSEWLEELGRPPTETELRGVLLPLLSGLEKVHQAGFLHRDLKPENIYLTHESQPILLDFGSARQALGDRTQTLTSIVSAGYAPFEQYHEDGQQGPWSDLYALGAVMYRCIHGKKPPEATRRLKGDTTVNLASTYTAKYSRPFLTAIDRALTLEIARRPQTVAAWRQQFVAPQRQESTPTMLTRRPTAGDSKLRRSESDTARTIPQKTPLLPAPAPFRFTRPQTLMAAGAAVVLLILAGVIWKVLSPAPGNIVVNEHPAVDPTVGDSSGAESAAHNPARTDPHSGTASSTLAPPAEQVKTAPVVLIGVDSRMVGEWDSAGVTAMGPWALHWAQKADGHYAVTGSLPDSGTVSAADGHMAQNSETLPAGGEIVYRFNDANTLVTNGPGGITTWKRTGTGAVARSERSERPAGGQSSHQGSGTNGNSGGSHASDHEWIKYLPSNLPSPGRAPGGGGFPFHRPF